MSDSRTTSPRNRLLQVVIAAGTILLLATRATRATAQQAVARTLRPVILLVHGRGMFGRDTAVLRADWQHALEAGARSGTPSATGPLFTDGDVRLVWYADVLDPMSSASCGRDTVAHQKRQSDGLADVVFGLTGILAVMAGDSAGANMEVRGLAGDLLYVGDPARRCAAEERLLTAVSQARAEHRPVIVVAHSLGSLVAYGALRSASTGDATIHRLVTLGSPLGAAELRELVFKDGVAGPVKLPANVRSWVNIREPRDPIAIPLSAADSTTLRDLVGSGSADGVDAHDMAGYLRDAMAGRAIAWAWCSAFERPSTAPAACGGIADPR